MKKLVWIWRRLQAMEPGEVRQRFAEKVDRLGRDRSLRLAKGEWKDQPLASVQWPALPPAGACPLELKRAVVARGEEILAGNWRVFGGEIFRTAFPPDWPRGCGAGPGPGFDKRQVWEINRGAHATALAQAFYLTGEERFQRAVLELWEDWEKRVPTGEGLPWANAMESGLRLIHMAWTDALAGGIPSDLVRTHVWWTRRHLSFGSSANNHLLGELAGLVAAGRRWPELAREEDVERLREEMSRQFHPDGGNREQALHYHWFAWMFCWLALGEEPEGGGAYFAHLAEAEEPWDFGDSDDASILPLCSSEGEEIGDWLKWFRGESSDAGYWLGEFPRPTGAVEDGVWKVYASSGQAVLRRDGWKARLDFSELGYLGLAAHGHIDALHLSLWHGGRALLIDPGTGSYRPNDPLRAVLAGARAHNGPRPVDLPPFPKRDGIFLWTGCHAAPKLIRSEGGDVEVAWEFGGMRFVRRVKAEGFIIEDERISGKGEWGSSWWLAPECEVERSPEGVIVSRGDIQQFQMIFSAKDWAIETGVCSPRFGVTSETYVIRMRTSREKETLIIRTT